MGKPDPFKPVNIHQHQALVEEIRAQDARRGEIRFLFAGLGIIVLPILVVCLLAYAAVSLVRGLLGS